MEPLFHGPIQPQRKHRHPTNHRHERSIVESALRMGTHGSAPCLPSVFIDGIRFDIKYKLNAVFKEIENVDIVFYDKRILLNLYLFQGFKKK